MLIQYEMDDGTRRNKGVSKTSRSEPSRLMPAYERRPLKTVSLTPPDYKVQPHILLESYIEKEIRFAGIIPSIPVHLDATNRTDVLRVIDRGKREEAIPWLASFEQDAVLCLNAQNVKISRRDGNEELLLRLPIHEIAAICYIRDDDKHTLGIKFGDLLLSRVPSDDDVCQLAVLYCENRAAAEELCSLLGQCFQLVYTEATMQFLDCKLSEAAAGMSIGSSTLRSDKSSTSSPPKKDQIDHKNLGFLSQSSLDLHNGNGTLSSVTSRSLPRTTTRRSSTARSESDLSAAANEMIQDYMKKLYNKLNPEELRRFAMLVKAWHTTMPFNDFCEKVLELYGAERKYLLLGMRPFIPEKDSLIFEAFLERIGLSNGGSLNTLNMNENNNSYKSLRKMYNGGSSSLVSGASESRCSTEDYEQEMSEISHDLSQDLSLDHSLESHSSNMEMSLRSDSFISSKRS